MTNNIFAVVVTYNRKRMLLECLEALLNQTKGLIRIIIVDNNSSDGTSHLLEMNGYMNRPEIYYFRLNENSGGAGGFHYGMRIAYEKGAEWIWIMDDDCQPSLNALQNLVQHIEDNSIDNGIVACKIVDNLGTICNDTRGNLCFKNSFRNNFRYKNNSMIYEKQYSVISFASFVGPLIHRTVIDILGYPRPEFFIYHDDLEYSIRAYNKNIKITLVNTSEILHKYESRDENAQLGAFLAFQSRYPRVPISNVWKNYFANRNLIILCSKYQKDRLNFYLSLIAWLLKGFMGILLYDNYKAIRIQLMADILSDGLNSNFANNQKYVPSKWRANIAAVNAN